MGIESLSKKRRFEGSASSASVKVLMDMIEEELEKAIQELNPYHGKDGKLASAKPGNTYSLSEPAVKKAGWKTDTAKKGIVSKNKRLSYKFGMPSQCGRKTVKGKSIPARKSCSEFPKPYQNENEEEMVMVPLKLLQDLFSVVAEQEPPTMIDEGKQSEMIKQCKSIGMVNPQEYYRRLLTTVSQVKNAVDGKTGE